MPTNTHRAAEALDFMQRTGTYVVPVWNDTLCEPKGWTLRTRNGSDVDLKFIIEAARGTTHWPAWRTPIDAILAYRDWLAENT